MDAEKERLIRQYLDEHRRMVDRERESAIRVVVLGNRFYELREAGKKVDEDYANTKRKMTAFMVAVVCCADETERRTLHWRSRVRSQ